MINCKLVARLCLKCDHSLLIFLGQSQVMLEHQVCTWQVRVSIVRKPVSIDGGRSEGSCPFCRRLRVETIEEEARGIDRGSKALDAVFLVLFSF